MSRSGHSPRRFHPSFVLLTLAALASGPGRAYAQQPPNDDCVNRVLVSDGPTAFSTVGATTDGGAVSCGFGPAFNDVWFNYTPPGIGTLSVSLCGSNFDTVLAVYGDCVTCPPLPLAEIACSDDSCALQSELTLPVTGQCYKIRIGGFDAADVGSGVLLVTFTPAPPIPPNDDCAAAQMIGNGVTAFDLTSCSPDGPASNCIGSVPDRGVWFHYTATCTGTLEVELTAASSNGVGYDLYDTCTCPVASSNTLICSAFPSTRTLSVVTGQCMLIRVYGFSTEGTGPGALTLTCFPPPANDGCAGAIPISDGTTLYDVRGATPPIPPSPSCTFGSRYNDVWFDYTATCTGAVRITGIPQTESHEITVYDTCACPETEPPLACVFVGFPQSTGTFPVTAGQCYKIRISAFSAESSFQGSMTLACFTPPANDDCAASVSIFQGVTPYDATAATSDGPGGCFFTAGDVWYDYTATCTGGLNVSIGPMNNTVPVAIYSGCACPVGQELGCAGGIAGASAFVVAGQCYKIRVGPAHEGPSTINLTCTPAPINDLCADRAVISNGTTAYTTAGAGTDGTNPTTACGDILGDVWFNYTATCDGSLIVQAIDQASNAVFAVYSGCGPSACSPLTEVGCGFVFSALTVPNVTAGQCFKIRVGSSFPGPGVPGTLTVSCVGTPPNDDCALRQPVSTGFTPFDAGGATLDGPATSCGSPGFDFVGDVWFNYTATCTGSLSMGAFNDEGYQYGMVVYGSCGCPVTQAQEVPLACDLFGFGVVRVDNVTVGDCFKIRVGSPFGGSLGGPSTLVVNCHTPPANDSCATPQVIGNGEFPYDATEATTDGPAVACTGTPIENDVWFDYTATCDGFLQISTSSFNTAAIALYSACSCPSTDFTEIPGTCGFGSIPLLPVTAGQCFKIRVGGAPFSPAAAGTLYVSCIPPAGNDLCANRVPIDVGTTPFSTLGADTDGPLVPCLPSGQIYHDLWYTYTPPCDGTLTVSLCDSAFDTALAVYKGCNTNACPPTAAPEVCSDNFCSNDDALVTLPVLAGQCYKIRVGGEFDAWGAGTITLSLDTPDADSDGTPDCADGCPNDPAKIAPGACGCGVADTDSDADGTADCIDGCPSDPLKVAPGICGCGTADTDSDADGTPNCIDGCPDDAGKIAPGACGCGVADTDSDADGTADCIDGCPSDPLKVAPGICGCGIADTDSDADGTPDCNDGCPNDPLKIATGACGCGVPDTDSDGDGTANCNDGCPGDPDKIAPGICGCGVADTDSDGDGTANCVDGCPADPLKTAPGTCGCGVPDTDSDGDSAADCIDGCPNDPLKVHAGDCGCGVSETDSDIDSIPDCIDNCLTVENLFQDDEDSDGVGDACDNCVVLGNPGQADCDNDSVGDACEIADGSPDCNLNGVPDLCDIANATSLDQNANLIPDECETNGGTPYCFGYSGCPCGNNSVPGSGQGCANSTGQGAILLGSGPSSLSNDQLTLTASNLPIPGMGEGFVLFFQGTLAANAPFQDGLRCVAGSQVRLGTKGHLNGTTSYPQGGDLPVSVKGGVTVPGPRYYQGWYRNVLGPCGTGSSLSNGVSVIWIP